MQPFYRAENTENLKTTGVQPSAFPYVRSTKTGNQWLVRQNIEVKNAKESNAKALNLLNKGVSSLGFAEQKLI